MRPLAAALLVLVASGASGQDLSLRLPASLGTPAEVYDDPPLATRLTPEAYGAAADDWLGRDKALHLGVSFGLTVGAHAALREGSDVEVAAARPLAAGFALGLGLAKELADERRQRRPLFSWKDLAADALGVALGVAAVSL
ncbi:MAG: hypothetical protein AAFQ43_12100 [Bacteroidota bacterium]